MLSTVRVSGWSCSTRASGSRGRARDKASRSRGPDAEEIEIHPGVGGEGLRHPPIKCSHPGEEDGPGGVQALPDQGGQLDFLSQHLLNHQGLAQDLGQQKDQTEGAIQDGGLELDELFVVQDQGRATKDHDQGQADPLHAINRLTFDAHQGDEQDRQANGDPGRPVQVYRLVDHKKRHNRQPVGQQLHSEDSLKSTEAEFTQ